MGGVVILYSSRFTTKFLRFFESHSDTENSYSENEIQLPLWQNVPANMAAVVIQNRRENTTKFRQKTSEKKNCIASVFQWYSMRDMLEHSVREANLHNANDNKLYGFQVVNRVDCDTT